MSLDFELLLVLLTLVTGVVWFWERWQRRRAGTAAAEAGEQGQTGASGAVTLPWWIDLARSLFPVILAVLVIRSFLVEPFRIPSGSMIPTLLAGDFILVNKFAYGLRLPVLHQEILDLGRPERGDVAVFRYPVDPSQDYIKRVVGLPGDEIRYVGKRLYINGELMPQELLGPYPEALDALVAREDLGTVEHRLLLHEDSPARGFRFTVPADAYFVMGDNRDRSSDSRFWGPVPEDNLVGEAFLIWMSWDLEDSGVNWGRIGNGIR